MTILRKRAWLVAGIFSFAPFLSLSPVRAACTVDSPDPAVVVVCISLEKDKDGKSTIKVEPDEVKLDRSNAPGKPHKVRWQIDDNDSVAQGVQWRIKWFATHKGSKTGPEIHGFDPFKTGSLLHPHRRTIPSGLAPRYVVTPPGKGLDQYTAPIYWKYSVIAKGNGLDLELKPKDPIVIWP